MEDCKGLFDYQLTVTNEPAPEPRQESREEFWARVEEGLKFIDAQANKPLKPDTWVISPRQNERRLSGDPDWILA